MDGVYACIAMLLALYDEGRYVLYIDRGFRTLTVKSLSTSRFGDLRSRCTIGGRQLCR